VEAVVLNRSQSSLIAIQNGICMCHFGSKKLYVNDSLVQSRDEEKLVFMVLSYLKIASISLDSNMDFAIHSFLFVTVNLR
jgi:hypothetical protein